MKSATRSPTAIGLAMFSMFFGAGNVVFPLLVGIEAESQNTYASLGLLLSGIGVPFLGLISMTLFEGDYKSFFSRIGAAPGFALTALILALIGPFGALPRCIALSFSTIKDYFPGLELWEFSLLSCAIIFWLSWRPGSLVTILGYILTPLLLACTLIIIALGFLASPPAPLSHLPWLTAFFNGFIKGYQTLDLLGAFFFSATVIFCLKENLSEEKRKDYLSLIWLTLKASCICVLILGLISLGFSWIAAFNSQSLHDIPKDELLKVVSLEILGPYTGLVAIATILLACLTTEIALATAFSEFVHKDVTSKKISFPISLIITLVIAFFVSLLHFERIINFLAPILFFCYPTLITFAFLNIFYKLYGFKPIKTPLALVLGITAMGYFFLGWG